jgi:hypothetical protein
MKLGTTAAITAILALAACGDTTDTETDGERIPFVRVTLIRR